MDITKKHHIAYLADKNLMQQLGIAISRIYMQHFCQDLLDNQIDIVSEIFDTDRRYDHPVLQVLRLYLFKYGVQNLNPMQHINELLEEHNFYLCMITEDEFPIIENDTQDQCFALHFVNNLNIRRRVYREICDKGATDWQLLGHFLIPFEKGELIYINNKDIEVRVNKILLAWEELWIELPEKKSKAWQILSGVLKLLEISIDASDFTGDVLKEEGHIDVEQYRGTDNLIIAFDRIINNIEIKGKSNQNQPFKKMTEDVDFEIKTFGDKMWIKIDKSIAYEVFEISSAHDQNINVEATQDRPHIHAFSHGDKLTKISTHADKTFHTLVQLIVNEREHESFIEYKPSGGKELCRLNLQNWLKECSRYILTYFSWDDVSFVAESFQFPPYVPGNVVSELAFLFMNTLLEIHNGIVSVITDYNTIEHVTFLKYNMDLIRQIGPFGEYTKRILILYPSPVIFMNIRCTYAVEFPHIQKEFRDGEKDIQCLLITHKNLIGEADVHFVNIVATPNYVGVTDDYICADCFLIDKDILETKDGLKNWFQAVLKKFISPSSSPNDTVEKSVFMKCIAHITGFLATRKSIQCTVPTLDQNTTKQVQSVMLNIDQLRILHRSGTKKKIIISNFGGGKTQLGLCELEYLATHAEENTKIFYICWSSRDLLVNDIKRFVDALTIKDIVKVHVIGLMELAQDLELSNITSLSQVVSSLFKRHKGCIVHIIIDEYDGEQLSLEIAQDFHVIHSKPEFKHCHIMLLPHSLGKYRTLVSSSGRQSHNKYQYQATGLSRFVLDKCMRTTKCNYELISRIEAIICSSVVEYRHPKQTKQLPQFLKWISSTAIEKIEKESPNTNEVQPVPARDTTDHLIFEAPIDLDTAVAISKEIPLDKEIKTETQIRLPTFVGIGHGIPGRKPTYYYLEDNEISDHEVISRLAVTLEHRFLSGDISRLVLCNSSYHQYIMQHVLNQLGIRFSTYTKESNWSLRNTTDDHKDVLSGNPYILITNCEGCRGREADQAFVCIDQDDCVQKHLTLECMTRSTGELFIIGLKKPLLKESPSSKVEDLRKFFERWRSRSSTGIQSDEPIENSIGAILTQVIAENLLDSFKIQTIQHFNAEKPLVENEGGWKVNINSNRYRQYITNLQGNGVSFTENQDGANNGDVFKMLQIAEPVDEVKCFYRDSNSCWLSWKPNGYNYVVRRRDASSDWREVLRTTAGRCSVTNLVNGGNYQFSVTAYSTVVSSDPAYVNYIHKITYNGKSTFEDLEKLILGSTIDAIREKLSADRDLLFATNRSGKTLLMSSVIHNKPAIIKEFLQAKNCDPWTVDNSGKNAYHLSASAGHRRCLEALCAHDISNINRGDVNSDTPLHLASKFEHIGCVNLLLQFDCNTKIENKKGLTASDMGNEEIQRIINCH